MTDHIQLQQQTIDGIRAQYAEIRRKIEKLPDEGFVLQFDHALCYAGADGNAGVIHAKVFPTDYEPRMLILRGLCDGGGRRPTMRTLQEAKAFSLAKLAESEAYLDEAERDAA